MGYHMISVGRWQAENTTVLKWENGWHVAGRDKRAVEDGGVSKEESGRRLRWGEMRAQIT